MCYNRLIFHLVFSTHARERTIDKEHDAELYAIIVSAMKYKGAFVHAIGGMPDHVHIIVETPPDVLLPDFVKSVKQYSSTQLSKNPNFPSWKGWSKSYSAFTCSPNDMNGAIRYVRGQKEHHSVLSTDEELRNLFAEMGLEYKGIGV